MTREGTVGSLRAAIGEFDVAGVFDGIGRNDDDPSNACSCQVSVDGKTLVVDADGCDGNLATAPDCRQRVVDTLADRDANRIVARDTGLEYRYRGRGVELLVAAGRFVDRIDDRNERLASTVRRDPLSVVDELESRVTGASDLESESKLVDIVQSVDGYESVLSPTVGLTIGHYRLDPTVPDDARLRDVRGLETGSEVRIYERQRGVPQYALDIVDLSVSNEERTRLLEGYEAIAEGDVEGERAAERALEDVSDEPPNPVLKGVLTKHTSGYGVLEDLFADPRLSDVYVTAPVSQNPLRVVVDGESMATNVYLTRDGAKALASRVRRTSGRAFSRASPTVDATATLMSGPELRVAGITEPVSEGEAFAFRKRADDRFTLPALVANGTVPVDAAALLSIAVERNAATLIAGTRGAGKTTLLGTLLYELPPETRTVVLEDTPELPVDALQSVGRDVQALRTGGEDDPEITPEAALRTALRLGDGALVVGEIRGAEACVLYEAMRVGANANAVLGTIHGDGADDVYERVVSDLGVAPSSFGTTDLIVTVQSYRTAEGRTRRLARIEEVIGDGDDHRFEPLYELEGERAAPTGRIDRGESRLVDRLAGPAETYADVRQALERRANRLDSLAADGRTSPRDVAETYAEHRRSPERA
ncbi:type II/IV secretion system ATPase subunit [Natronolimnohabitans sp. A-GB9]|uniref:type II/IV secretion system ATPase subunit n=1 Tax=Natronolimnohabitans sp. A-GB9 TaxID=3069757 RepID=UPI0027AE13A3|nr:type II/IV secretion system ATPase subunit [Natronolimnohabitans sp. A-GB9]MDQ2052729.1 type II/IV secretion system ATPase subunit [Natronolimnohabitans sp. A-GB9]